MKTGLIILIVFFLVKPQIAQAQTEAFIWILGTWKNEKKDAYENWVPGPQSGFIGKSFLIEAGDTVVLEKMQIFRKEDLFYFLPGNNGNGKGEPEPLLIRRFNSAAFFAENPDSKATRKVHYQMDKNQMQKTKIDAGSRASNYTYRKLE